MKFVIMAGGLGTKLWPLSKEQTPKQFINTIGDKTLFRLNLEALLTKYQPSDIFISITEEFIHFIKQQAPEIPESNYIVEPSLNKGSGPACTYAMLKVGSMYPDEVVMFYVQAVVTREPVDRFIYMIEEMEKAVKQTGLLVTGGKKPDYPELGSDYINLGEKLNLDNDLSMYRSNGFINFVKEQKTIEDAQKLLDEDKVCLHCNHYTWTYQSLMSAVQSSKPDWFKVLMKIKEVLGTENEYEKIKKIYAEFEVGRMEEVTTPLFDEGKVIVTMLPYNWTHITTWDDIYNYRKNRSIPTTDPNVIEIEGENNLILSSSGKLVTTIGLKDFVIVETEKEILVMPRSESTKLPVLIDKIKGKKPENL